MELRFEGDGNTKNRCASGLSLHGYSLDSLRVDLAMMVLRGDMTLEKAQEKYEELEIKAQGD